MNTEMKLKAEQMGVTILDFKPTQFEWEGFYIVLAYTHKKSLLLGLGQMVASIMGIILVASLGPIGGKPSRTLIKGSTNYSTKGLDSSGPLIELLNR